MDRQQADAALASSWARAGQCLGLEVLAPFTLTLPSGGKVFAAALVKQFGATNGMLLTPHADVIWSLREEIVRAGFGFSVLEGARPGEPFVVDGYVEVLQEWGWSGSAEAEPVWMKTLAPANEHGG